MDEAPPGGDPPALLVWCLATFHVALLVSLLVAGLYLAGAAGDVLAGLGTTAGIASYLYLWGITWWTNRRWLEAVGAPMAAGHPVIATAAKGALRWGGVTGLLFFAGLFVAVAGAFIATSGLQVAPFLLLGGLVGAVAAIAAGGIVGVLFAMVDGVLSRVATVGLADGDGEAPSARS